MLLGDDGFESLLDGEGRVYIFDNDLVVKLCTVIYDGGCLEVIPLLSIMVL